MARYHYMAALAPHDHLLRRPFTLDIADWMPDTARTAYGEYNQGDPCMHNSAGPFGDQNMAADDVSDFLNEFGRSTFNKPCPACK